MKTNKNMGGMELLNKAWGKKKQAEQKLQGLGANLRKSYDDAQAKWKASPRYKRAQKRAQYEGAI